VPADPFGPARLGPVQLRSRVLKAATLEGMSPANIMSGSLVDFHRRFAAGGVAMTTVSSVASIELAMAEGFDFVAMGTALRPR
jgi:2,4-dienoyl-CoA reductase-like NADH-dependent reductase (Old Yellow Enzyme family)